MNPGVETRSGPPPAARTALAWSAVFLGGLGAAAALAPAVHWALAASGSPWQWPFSRVFDRVAMVAALLTLIRLRRFTGWSELGPLLGVRPGPPGPRFGSFGFSERGAELAAGLLAAVAAVGAGVAWAFAAGRLGPPETAIDPVTTQLLSILFGSTLAASIEEVFFRGLLLGSFAAHLRWPTAAWVSSALYAGIHLLASDPGFVVRGFEPGAGFRYLGHALARQLEPAALPPLAGLFLAGLVLALIVRLTGSLYYAVGLHAGWAASFRIVRRATHVLSEIPGTSFLATHHFLVGTPWAWAAIALAGALVHAGFALAARRRSPAPREAG
jgi:membrane protease YdiL (CAAX protease family)